jgi:hypothetical protein
MIKILHNLALFWVKNANFFGENIFKIDQSGHPAPMEDGKIMNGPTSAGMHKKKE